MKLMPVRNADIELLIADVFIEDDDQIEQRSTPNKQGNFKFEITAESVNGYCRKTHTFFAVDQLKRIYILSKL
jgi:hypothetical protein